MQNLNYVRKVIDYFNTNESTVRQTALVFGISKSTVYNYLTKVHPNETSRKILERNKAEAPLRGGNATRKKYLILRS